MNKTRKMKIRKTICAAVLLMATLTVARPIVAYAADNPLKLTIRQIFDAAAAPAQGDTFTYRFKSLDAGSPMPAGSTADIYTFTIAGTADKVIGPIGYTRPGVYRYELRQVSEQKPGYIYDERAYTIAAYVDSSLRVEIIVTNADGTKAQSIAFRNIYGVLPSDPALMADPPVRKTVSGNPKNNGIFTFKLAARDASNPMPAGSAEGVKMVRITGQGEENFGTWSYGKAGTYYYDISEVNAGEAGYTYDKTIYTITDTVVDENGRLVLSRVITNAQNKQVTTLAFINQYNEGKDGPKTGDEMNKTLYIALFAAGGALAVGAVIFLIASRRRKGGKAA